MPRLVPSACADGVAERDADVLDGVMGIDIEIAAGVDREIEAAMPRDELEHVIEEAESGLDRVGAAAIEIQAKPNLRLRRPAINARATQGRPPGPRADSRVRRRCRR